MGLIIADPSVIEKITTREGRECTLKEVREAYERRSDVEIWEREDGTVAGFGTTADGKRLFAAFHPVDPSDGIWRLRTAYPV